MTSAFDTKLFKRHCKNGIVLTTEKPLSKHFFFVNNRLFTYSVGIADVLPIDTNTPKRLLVYFRPLGLGWLQKSNQGGPP